MANGLGRRTVMLDLSGATRWLYDSRGRVTQESKVISGSGTFVTQWSYDAADRLVWQKYPGGANGELGEQVSFAYTPQGLLDTVIGAATYVGDTQYNVRGQVSERRLGSTTGVVKQLYSYAATENFRLIALKSGISPNFNTLQNITYNYDDAGNVLTIADAAAFGGSQTQSFSYDALDRLATAQATGGSHGAYAQRSYQYNNAGNLTSFEGSAYGYHDAAHKHGVTHIGGVQKYWGACPERSRRDANGNVTRRIAPWGTDITLAYDAENRLTQVSNGVTASYTYDGDGVRVKAVVGATTSVYVGAYYEVTGGVVKKYYYAGGVRVAENNGGTLYFLLSDHLGSTAVTTDASGVRVTELRYYPYGDSERYNPGGQITTFRFTGQRWDPGTGLYWYNSRWYDPLIGRFIQADTIVPQPGNPQNLNRYSYVRNNPLRYTDPSGHWPIPPRFPIEQVIFRILNDPYVKPLWQNPQIGAPVLYSAYREAKGDAPEALSLTLDWYFERGEAPRDIGSDSEITQFLITSRGVQEAREQFAKGGGQDMTLAAKNAAHHEFTWEAVPELYKALRYDDWCGSFLGSFDVEFENLQGYDGPGKLVAVRVINDTGWQSATKIPFTQRTTRQNVDRSDPGPGGTLLQYYRWWEIIDVE